MNPSEPSQNAHSNVMPRRGRWFRRLVVAALIVGVLGACHGSILRGIAGPLVADGGRRACTAVVVLDEGDGRFDMAAVVHRQGAGIVLLLRRQPGRLERLGILPTTDELAHHELLKRGVAETGMVLLPEVSIGKSKLAAVLRDWMLQHPDETVDVLCEEFNSRTWRLLFDRLSDSEVRRRVQIVPLPDRLFDESNWWRSKEGTLALVDGYFTLGFHWLRCGEEPDRSERTQADFRAVVSQRSGGTP